MNTRSLRSATTFSALILAASLGACGAAHTPAAAQGEITDRFVATDTVVSVPVELGEVLVQASRLPAEPVAALDEIVVTAKRIADTTTPGNHNLDEIVVSATRLPNSIDVGSSGAQVAALLD